MKSKSLRDYVIEYEQQIEELELLKRDCILNWFENVVDKGTSFIYDKENVIFQQVVDGKIEFKDNSNFTFMVLPHILVGRLEKDNEIFV